MIKFLFRFLIFLFILFYVHNALAETPEDSTPISEPSITTSSLSIPSEQLKLKYEIDHLAVPLLEGEPSPYDGILLDENMVYFYVDLRNRYDRLARVYDITLKLCVDKEYVSLSNLDKCEASNLDLAKENSKLEGNSQWNFFLGVVAGSVFVGIVTTVVLWSVR